MYTFKLKTPEIFLSIINGILGNIQWMDWTNTILRYC